MTIAGRIRAAREARTPRCSQANLAAELSKARWGMPDQLDRQAVYRWESGRRVPREWLPFLEQVLDLEVGDADGGRPVHDDSVTAVMHLGDTDVDRREFLTASAGVGMAALDVTDAQAVTRRVLQPGTARVGVGDVDAVRTMTTTLGNAAAELGGGHARHLAVRYLTVNVHRWLNGRYTEAVGRDLFAATSELAQLIGWMARDEGEQGLCQRYHLHAFRLADEAGSSELAATALRGLADQAVDLGHLPVAVRLAEACEQRGRRLANPKALAYYRNTYARALAADGDRVTAGRMLTGSQRAIEQAPARPGQSWASHYSAGRWAHESGMIHAKLGDYGAAEEHLRIALDVHGLDRKRTRAIVLADLGHVQLKRGDSAAALESWNLLADCAAGIRSVKVDDGVSNIKARLSSIPDRAGAAALGERLAAR